MCGILALLAIKATASSVMESCPEARKMLPSLARRGPSRQGWFERDSRRGGEDGDRMFSLAMHAAVLHLRGEEICQQPAVDDGGNALCWNGEVFGGSLQVERGASDTSAILSLLVKACEDGGQGVVSALSGVEGPFAIAFWDERAKTLWFGRDRLGRRSLLVKRPEAGGGWGGWGVASCIGSGEALRAVRGDGGDAGGWEEVPPGGMWRVDAKEDLVRFEVVAWPERCGGPLLRPTSLFDMQEDRSEAEGGSHGVPDCAVMKLLGLLNAAVSERVAGTGPRIGPMNGDARDQETGAAVCVLFSGGIDSMVLAALAHAHVPEEDPIDLVNVCFDPCEAPDRYTAIDSLRELRTLYPSRRWNLITVDVSEEDAAAQRERIHSLLYPCDTQMDLNIGTALWFGSQGVGTLYGDPTEDTGEEVRQRGGGGEGKGEEAGGEGGGGGEGGVGEEGDGRREGGRVCAEKEGREGISESLQGEGGGVDGGKDEKKVVVNDDADDDADDDGRVYAPKRAELFEAAEPFLEARPNITAKEMLRSIRSSYKTWILGEGRIRPVLSNLRKRRSKEERGGASTDATTGAPHRSGGRFVAGTGSDPRQWVQGSFGRPLAQVLGPGKKGVKSSARVLLMGMGADEQLCGYSRYRSKFLNNGGAKRVLEDMAGDMARIWSRNLGRDDRFLSDSGREARFPYLDEGVVSYLATLPLSSVADLTMPPGEGDKLLLRRVARELGLRGAAGEVKRAIQFGTRIAKLSNKATFGSNRGGSGTAKVVVD